MHSLLYIYTGAAAALVQAMKSQRQTAIRDLVVQTIIANQDDLRRKLARKGIQVTQATLSRDIRELNLVKGPRGYGLPGGTAEADFDDSLPAMAVLLGTFGLEVRQTGSLLVLLTAKGAAQPVAAGIDDEEWTECLGTIAGDNTVLLICADAAGAQAVRQRLEAHLG